MGNCVSQPGKEDKERSDAIDRQIEDDSKKFKRECKILLLGVYQCFLFDDSTADAHAIGSGESGKSTIVKQMRIIHKDGFPESERLTYCSIVYRNVLDSIQAIIVAMRKLDIDCTVYSNRVSNEAGCRNSFPPCPFFLRRFHPLTLPLDARRQDHGLQIRRDDGLHTLARDSRRNTSMLGRPGYKQVR